MNFSPLGQFLAKVFTIYNATVNTTQNTKTQQNTNLLAQNQNTALLKTSISLESALTVSQADLQNLTEAQTTKYLKEILQLPKDLTQLVESLAANSKNNLVSVNTLKSLLQTSGKEALNEIVKTISKMNQQGVYKTEQLSEMMKFISSIIPNADTQTIQILKNIILLYLPWLPLGANIDFELRLGVEQNDGSGSVDDDCMTIIIQTVNFGLIKILLMIDKEDKTKVMMKINCPNEFPKVELQKLMETQTLAYNVKTSVEYKTIELQHQKLKNNQPQVDMQTSNEINPYLMIAAQSIIRQVVDIDKRFSKGEIKREKIE